MLVARPLLVRLVLAAACCAMLATAAPSTFALESGAQCSNCIDDDADGFADRKDSDCPPVPANGGGIGIGDATRGKVIATCAKNAQKAGFKFVLDVMKRFQKCTQAAATCIQAKPTDPGCQAKATATCAKAVAGFDASAAKLQAAIVAKCDPDGQNLADLQNAMGLGFAAEEAPCARETGVGNLSSIQNVASCMALQHFCKAQHLVTIATPRARELLRFAGRFDSEFPCIDDLPGADGAGLGVQATHVKKVLKCGKTIDKLGLALVGSGAKTVQTCLNAGIACLQVKSTDPTCLDKARAKCRAGFTKLQDPVKGTVGKLAAKFLKACGVQENLDLGDLVGFSGIGLSAELSRCQDLGASNPADCFGVQAFCEGGYVIEREVPRARELAALLNVIIPGFDF
jgi:hypothetical protein